MYELDLIADQEKREQQDLERAEEWGFATLELAELVRRWGKAAIANELATYPDLEPEPLLVHQPTCAQCVNWQPPKSRLLANGSTYVSPGFCQPRAAADLEQPTQDYAQRCHLYVEAIPF